MLHEMVASIQAIRAFRVGGDAWTELDLHVGLAPYQALRALIPSAAQRESICKCRNRLPDFE